jgi:hypothetical protein
VFVCQVADVDAGVTGRAASAGVTATGGSASNLVYTAATDTYTVDITPDSEGEVFVEIGAGVATDYAGNANTISNKLEFLYDGTRPTTTLSSPASNPTNVSPIPFTLTTSETVFGITASDFTVTGGTAGNLATSNADKTFTFDVTPSSCATGTGCTVTVGLPANTATDLAGNGVRAPGTVSRTYDATGPTVALSSTTSGSTNAPSITVTTTFSEAVTGFALTDIVKSANIALTGNFIDGSTAYIVTTTFNADGVATIQVPANVATDATGNGNQASSVLSVTSDRTQPTVVLAFTGVLASASGVNCNSGATDCSLDSPFELTAQFSEPVFGLTSSDFTFVTNVASVTVTAVTTSKYRLGVTPTNVNADVVVTIVSGAASDATGNVVATSNTVTVYYNALPYVTLVSRSVSTYANIRTAIFVFTVNQLATWKYKLVNQYSISDVPSFVNGASGAQVAAGVQQTISLTNVYTGLNQLHLTTTDATSNTLVRPSGLVLPNC